MVNHMLDSQIQADFSQNKFKESTREFVEKNKLVNVNTALYGNSQSKMEQFAVSDKKGFNPSDKTMTI